MTNPYSAAGRLFPAFFKPSIRSLATILALVAAIPFPSVAQKAVPTQPPVLLDAMTTELHRAFTSLGKQTASKDAQLPPYFLSYSVSDASVATVRAQYGAVVDSSANHVRIADIQVRLGDPKLDNTHGTHRGSAVNSLQLPLTDDREALARSLWVATNTGYGNALDNYLRVKTEAEVRAKEEDTSPDFSRESRIWARPLRPWWLTGRRGANARQRYRRFFASILT